MIDHVGQNYTREERETTMTRSEAGDHWSIYTASPVMARRLTKLAAAWGVEVQPYGDSGIVVDLPLKAISFRNPLVISDERKAESAARLQRAREQKAALEATR